MPRINRKEFIRLVSFTIYYQKKKDGPWDSTKVLGSSEKDIKERFGALLESYHDYAISRSSS